jgi:hypothetical protein
LTGRVFNGLPPDLTRDYLDELTAQPLLNYLVALSYSFGRVDFSQNVPINAIYADLIAAVHERAYEKHGRWTPIRAISLADFSRVLEEIAVAAWQGNGRSTTVAKIRALCERSGITPLLEQFKAGATDGVTRLLGAFFFRTVDDNMDGEQAFMFTHKSFGEYLAAKRLWRLSQEMVTRTGTDYVIHADYGSVRSALEYWLRFCGPTRMTPYILTFLRNECAAIGKKEAVKYQERFTTLFAHSI